MQELEFLGEGGFGKVIKAYQKNTGEFMAIKFFLKYNEETFVDISQENELLKQIEQINKNNSFLKYKGLFKDKNHPQTLIILMESGEISLKEILKMRKFYDLPNTMFIFKALLKQLIVLQENGISNRDLKPANIILVSDKESSDLYDYKLSDFGIGCKLPKGVTKTDEFNGSTPKYAAPEVLNLADGDYYNPFLADVYSLGVMIKYIFGEDNSDPFLDQILAKMLKIQPEKRWDFKKILEKINKNKYIEVIQPKNEKKRDPGNLELNSSITL